MSCFAWHQYTVGSTNTDHTYICTSYTAIVCSRFKNIVYLPPFDQTSDHTGFQRTKTHKNIKSSYNIKSISRSQNTSKTHMSAISELCHNPFHLNPRTRPKFISLKCHIRNISYHYQSTEHRNITYAKVIKTLIYIAHVSSICL